MRAFLKGWQQAPSRLTLSLADESAFRLNVDTLDLPLKQATYLAADLANLFLSSAGKEKSYTPDQFFLTPQCPYISIQAGTVKLTLVLLEPAKGKGEGS